MDKPVLLLTEFIKYVLHNVGNSRSIFYFFILCFIHPLICLFCI